ncbi:hypothetical protein I41_37760 [Lacipirellula limnantheis]|uniref:Uncharacterized protein n=1 Tax=Lacipirellula limnantheis TaxID=2528024 RepID=A0A517U1R5_9BACT|nr:hypothetical protein I41_37760 [Lacipirellula limnantheis]
MMATTAVTVSKRRTVNLSSMAQRQSPAAMSTKPSMSTVKMNLGPFMSLTIAGGEVARELRYNSGHAQLHPLRPGDPLLRGELWLQTISVAQLQTITAAII